MGASTCLYFLGALSTKTREKWRNAGRLYSALTFPYLCDLFDCYVPGRRLRSVDPWCGPPLDHVHSPLLLQPSQSGMQSHCESAYACTSLAHFKVPRRKKNRICPVTIFAHTLSYTALHNMPLIESATEILKEEEEKHAAEEDDNDDEVHCLCYMEFQFAFM